MNKPYVSKQTDRSLFLCLARPMPVNPDQPSSPRPLIHVFNLNFKLAAKAAKPFGIIPPAFDQSVKTILENKEKPKAPLVFGFSIRIITQVHSL